MDKMESSTQATVDNVSPTNSQPGPRIKRKKMEEDVVTPTLPQVVPIAIQPKTIVQPIQQSPSRRFVDLKVMQIESQNDSSRMEHDSTPGEKSIDSDTDTSFEPKKRKSGGRAWSARVKWTQEEEDFLVECKRQVGEAKGINQGNWKEVADIFIERYPYRTKGSITMHWAIRPELQRKLESIFDGTFSTEVQVPEIKKDLKPEVKLVSNQIKKWSEKELDNLEFFIHEKYRRDDKIFWKNVFPQYTYEEVCEMYDELK
jgi:hypothetical protein